MAVKIGSARMDERGKANGGKAGDQTGLEVSTQNWYKHSKGWVVLRAKDAVKAAKIASAMSAACANNKIGYDQYQRLTLYNAAKPLGFSPAKVATACETDCSALVRVCCAYAGITVVDFTTTNQVSKLMATGQFEKYTSSRYTASSDYLCAGDILVTKTKGHTVIVLTDGKLATKSNALGSRTLAFKAYPCMTGDDVRALQKLLISWGYACGKDGADGEYGPATVAAVVAWQYDNGLPETGIMDDDDYAKITDLLSPDDPQDDPGTDDGDDSGDPGESESAQCVTVVGGNTVHVRTAPSTAADIMGVAYRGDSYDYAGETAENGWYKIAFGDSIGWITNLYTKLADKPVEVDGGEPPVPEVANPVIVDLDQHSNLKSGKHDWDKYVKAVHLSILRCGVTRTATKPLGIGKDDDFSHVAKELNKRNAPFGVYFYGKVKTAAEARKEARKAFEVASPYNPLFYCYDVEESRLTNACLQAFADELRKLGVKKVGLYVGHNYYNTFKASVKHFDFVWIPRYGKNTGKYDPKYKPAHPCDIHQYTSVGKIAGIADSTLDINRLTGTKPLSWFLER